MSVNDLITARLKKLGNGANAYWYKDDEGANSFIVFRKKATTEAYDIRNGKLDKYTGDPLFYPSAPPENADLIICENEDLASQIGDFRGVAAVALSIGNKDLQKWVKQNHARVKIVVANGEWPTPSISSQNDIEQILKELAALWPDENNAPTAPKANKIISEKTIAKSNESMAASSEGKLIRNTDNIIRAICHFQADFNYIFAYNEFKKSYEFHAPTGGGKIEIMNAVSAAGVGVMSDEVTAAVAALIQNKMAWPSCPTKRVHEALMLVARMNSYHPVREWLTSLKWDNEPRLESWLPMVTKISPNMPPELVAEYGKCFLVAAVARIMNAGCKFDHILIFEGKQGAGKSPLVQILFGEEWSVAASVSAKNDNRLVELCSGSWGIELDELDGFNRRDDESLKAFISRQTDKARLAYRRNAEEYPRECVFIGTTNRKQYLTDTTGGKRFWPVELATDADVDLKLLATLRTQLWAEAMHLYHQSPNERFLQPSLYETSEEWAMKRFMGTGILAVLASKKSDLGNSPTIGHILAILDHRGPPSQGVLRDILQAMQFLGYEPQTENRTYTHFILWADDDE